jgi:hypothetical protein
MSVLRRVILGAKALKELGFKQLGLYGLYQLGLRSGVLRRFTEYRGPGGADQTPYALKLPVIALPDPADVIACLGDEGVRQLFSEAGEIVAGRVRLFGGEPVPLTLVPPGELVHWTRYERGEISLGVEDIKFIWEPGRFGWAYTLGRAYHLSGDEVYAEAFWKYLEIFSDANPPYLGPHWISAQEVALRIMALIFAASVFEPSSNSTPIRMGSLAQAVANHAARIPPTLTYARAQNNNHLLVEAVGLLTASLALPGHPSASRWGSQGLRWMNWALENQIAWDGTYIQHSTNYHRLMLQAALWAYALFEKANEAGGGRSLRFLDETLNRLRDATRWLLGLQDPESGSVPNLGPNDGAYIFPLTTCAFDDYRPVLQAAGRAFLGEILFETGSWDEMCLWFCPRKAGEQTPAREPYLGPHVLREPESRSWAYFRVATFKSRPGHADQLHLDLWWRGMNMAQDPGTYRYNAAEPWDNALAHTGVHNTVTVDGEEQMTRAGRFLYLDWAQGQVLAQEADESGKPSCLVAQHDGYQRRGVVHQRAVTFHRGGRWLVEDRLLPIKTSMKARDYRLRLHWLLPDWPWDLGEISETASEIQLHSPGGMILIRLSAAAQTLKPSEGAPFGVSLVRAGQLLHGQGAVSPVMGWVSPTYGQKLPALSLALEVEASLPLTFRTEWVFP